MIIKKTKINLKKHNNKISIQNGSGPWKWLKEKIEKLRRRKYKPLLEKEELEQPPLSLPPPPPPEVCAWN
jgi:hypothetical protein